MEIKSVQINRIAPVTEAFDADGIGQATHNGYLSFEITTVDGQTLVVPNDTANTHYWAIKDWYDAQEEKPFDFEFEELPEPNFSDTVYQATPEEIEIFLKTRVVKSEQGFEVDFFQTLIAIAAGAVALGGVIYGAIGGRSKAELELLRRMNADLRQSNTDYQTKIDSFVESLATANAKIASLENEKLLPLETLTNLVIKNDAAQLRALRDIAKALKIKDTSESEA